MTLAFPKPTPKTKQPRPFKRGKPMRRISPKKAKYRSSDEGKAGLHYMGLVKDLPCCVCGKPGPSEAHHCQDRPPHGVAHPYNQLPCGGRKSGDMDTIPLCTECHSDQYPLGYHKSPERWNERHGADWTYIEATRQAVAELETGLMAAWD